MPGVEELSGEELMEELKGAGSDEIAHIKQLAENNLYFMCKGILGMKDVNKRTHGAFCKFIQSEAFDRKMALMPRGHLKSSIGTVGDSVRIAVRSKGEARIMIANEIDGNAVAFMNETKGHFERNELVRFLWAELIPERFAGQGVQWSSAGATLVRRGNYKEPTFFAIGVGGAVTSKHFTHIKLDDLIGLEAKRSEVEMKKAVAWNSNVESLGVGDRDTHIDWIGTRWTRTDLYFHVMRDYGQRLKVFRRPMIENGELIFPEKYTWEGVELLKKKPDIWTAQYLNDPTSDEALDFSEELLRFFEFDNDGSVVYRTADGPRKWPRAALDVVITVDPNSGKKTATDEAAITVSAMAPDGRVFVLESYGGRLDPTKFIDKIYQLAIKWRPRVIGIEVAGQQTTLHYFKEKCREEMVFFRIEELKHKNQAKEQRIRESLHPVISDCRLYLLRSQDELKQQIVNFPDVLNDDRIDSLAYAADLWRKPLHQEQQEKNNALVQKILKRRHSRTGY